MVRSTTRSGTATSLEIENHRAQRHNIDHRQVMDGGDLRDAALDWPIGDVEQPEGNAVGG